MRVTPHWPEDHQHIRARKILHWHEIAQWQPATPPYRPSAVRMHLNCAVVLNTLKHIGEQWSIVREASQLRAECHPQCSATTYRWQTSPPERTHSQLNVWSAHSKQLQVTKKTQQLVCTRIFTTSKGLVCKTTITNTSTGNVVLAM